MTLTLTKTRLKGAQTGHSLLAKKRDALTLRFRAILKKVDEVSSVKHVAIQFRDQNVLEYRQSARWDASCKLLPFRWQK